MLTVINLCDGLRAFLEHAANHKEGDPLPPNKFSVGGVPGDDAMKKVMALCGDEIIITIRAIPPEVVDDTSQEKTQLRETMQSLRSSLGVR